MASAYETIPDQIADLQHEVALLKTTMNAFKDTMQDVHILKLRVANLEKK